jgi:hypothetical protein
MEALDEAGLPSGIRFEKRCDPISSSAHAWRTGRPRRTNAVLRTDGVSVENLTARRVDDRAGDCGGFVGGEEGDETTSRALATAMPLSISVHQSNKDSRKRRNNKMVPSWTVQWLLVIEAADAIAAAE